VNGRSVPANARPTIASVGTAGGCIRGTPSTSSAAGTLATAAAASWTAVTATGSRPASIPGAVVTNIAESTSDPSTNASPVNVDPDPPCEAMNPIPANAAAKPSQDTGPTLARPRPTVNSATSTGVAPTMSAAWLTLVRAMPEFCNTITRP
jgi:hypothetical protein